MPAQDIRAPPQRHLFPTSEMGVGCPTGHTTQASLPTGSGGFYHERTTD